MKTDPPILSPCWSISALQKALKAYNIDIDRGTSENIQSTGLGQPVLNTITTNPLIAYFGSEMYTVDGCLPQLWWSETKLPFPVSRPVLYPLFPQKPSHIEHALRCLLASRFVLHGTLLNVYGSGLLLTGRHGIGKTSLALALVHRGHKIVCDDAPYFSYENGKLIGWSPPSIKNLYHLRNKGFNFIQKDFGHSAVADFAVLDLEIELCDKPQRLTPKTDISTRASAKLYSSTFHKKVFLPVESFDNLIILVEDMVRMAHKNQSTGCSQ